MPSIADIMPAEQGIMPVKLVRKSLKFELLGGRLDVIEANVYRTRDMLAVP
jgi:hypothetical protein